MGIVTIVLWVIGILALIQGVIAAFYPRQTKKFWQNLYRSIKKVRNVGIIEIIIAIVLILIAINI